MSLESNVIKERNLLQFIVKCRAPSSLKSPDLKELTGPNLGWCRFKQVAKHFPGREQLTFVATEKSRHLPVLPVSAFLPLLTAVSPTPVHAVWHLYDPEVSCCSIMQLYKNRSISLLIFLICWFNKLGWPVAHFSADGALEITALGRCSPQSSAHRCTGQSRAGGTSDSDFAMWFLMWFFCFSVGSDSPHLHQYSICEFQCSWCRTNRKAGGVWIICGRHLGYSLYICVKSKLSIFLFLPLFFFFYIPAKIEFLQKRMLIS